IPPPPTSTLFPYTTLFRSSEDADRARPLSFDLVGSDHDRAVSERLHARLGADGDVEATVEHVAEQRDDHELLLEHVEHLAHPARSEEHTSELQSRENLVCR